MRHLPLALLVAVAATFGIGEAQACRYLETQYLQLQVGGIQPGERDRARMLMNRLIADGCRRGTVQPAPEPRRASRDRRARSSSSASTSSASTSSASTSRRASSSGDRQARKQVSTRTSSFLKARDGRYRTMCVRSCDGYYFPISFATDRGNFARDAFICAQRCPAAETKLFYHTAISESAADMKAVDGTTYADLPNAFRHRVSYDPSCTCGSGSGASETLAAMLEGGSGTPESQPSSSLPVWRPAPGMDPETYANQVGGFEPSRASLAPPVVAVAGTEIRVVGPTDDTLKLLTPIPTGRP